MYLAVLLIVVIYYVIVGTLLSSKYYIHIHHYFIGMVMAAICGYPNLIITMVQAVGTVMLVEGTSHYGFDPPKYAYNPFTLSICEKITYYFHRQTID